MKITVIGAGNIGSAIAKGLYNQCSDTHSLFICLSDVEQDKLAANKAFCHQTETNNQLAVTNADIVILAVKPWLIDMVLNEINPILIPEKQIVISIASGVTIDHINEKLERTFALYRIIPNTAIAIGESMSLIVSENTTEEQDALITRLFEGMGKVQFISESLMGAGTALTSCGIAYALRYMRAATEGGVQLGFAADKAKELIAQTLIGAAQLVLQNHSHPEVEIDKVTTPGGITIKGLNAMEEAGFSHSIIKGLIISNV